MKKWLAGLPAGTFVLQLVVLAVLAAGQPECAAVLQRLALGAPVADAPLLDKPSVL